jgi:hypothetical protein
MIADVATDPHSISNCRSRVWVLVLDALNTTSHSNLQLDSQLNTLTSVDNVAAGFKSLRASICVVPHN